MPMVASLCLIASLIYALFDVPIKITTALEIHSSGAVLINLKREQCKSVVMLYKYFMIQITTDKGNRVRIWRDSCNDRDYRNLLVLLDIFMQKTKE